MPRANASVPPEAIRIEDEVFEEAFARREPASGTRRRRLRAIDGGQSDWLSDGQREWLSELHADWREDPPAARSVRERPLATAVFEAAGETELPAATWVGGSPSPRAESSVTTGARFQIATSAGEVLTTAGEVVTSTGESPPIRRTIKIQGRGAEHKLPLPDANRRRPTRRPYERAGFRPDRLAMWAVVLGFLLVLVAIASGHG